LCVHRKTKAKLKVKLKELTSRSNGWGYEKRKEKPDLCNPRVDKLLSACRDAQLSERSRRMAAQPHTNVHMEMLEKSTDTLQES